MRSLLVVCLVACLALVAGTANAGGQISDNTLAQMGIAGLQTMSDVQGTEVRGMGFSFGPSTSATSFASVFSTTTSGGGHKKGGDSTTTNAATAAGSATGSKLSASASVAVADTNILVFGRGFIVGVKGPVAVSVSIGVSGRH
jgi:hypothetical protein